MTDDDKLLDDAQLARLVPLDANPQGQAFNRRQDVTLPRQPQQDASRAVERPDSPQDTFDRSLIQRQRDELLIALVEAYGKASHEPFQYHRIGDDRALLFHAGFAGNSIEPNWEHIQALASAGFLTITPHGRGDSIVRLVEKSFDRYEALSAPDAGPSPKPATEAAPKDSTRVPSPQSRFEALHPRVIEAAGKLYADHHYSDAVRRAFVALINAVRTKSGREAQTDKDAMIQAFKDSAPALRLSQDKNEQQGFMWLFAGATAAIRNPLSHTTEEALDAAEAYECLTFASLLFRYLDRAEKSVPTNPEFDTGQESFEAS